MEIINIGLILFSAVCHSIWNILTQTSNNSQLFSGFKGIWLVVLALLYFIFAGAPPEEMWMWGLVSGVVHAFYIFCLSRAYTTLDISYVYPIARSAPALVPIFAYFFLGERLNILSLLGIGVILLAIYILHFEGHLISGFQKLLDAFLHKNFRWAFLTLFTVVFYSMWDKRAMELYFGLRPESKFQNGIDFFFMEAGACFLLYNIYLITAFPRHLIIENWKIEWSRGFLGGVATLGSYGLICIVLQFEAISKIVVLRQTSVVMVVYWGCWKLGESFGLQRVMVAILILIGVILVGWN